MLRYHSYWLMPVLLVAIKAVLLSASCGDDDTPKDSGNCHKPKSSNLVRIGIVACAGFEYMGHTHRLPDAPPPDDYKFLQSEMASEVMVLTKSALMSASLYHVPILEFRVFVDDRYLELWIHQIMKEYQKNFPHIDILYKTHYIFVNFPKGAHFQDIVLVDKCQNIRLLLPHTLPDVDKILYLDTDTVITGNIQKLWDYFKEMDNSEQMCGLAPNNVLEDKNFRDVDVANFGDVPHVSPKGVNSGVMLMDLDKMRKFGWIDKVLATYTEYDPKVEILQTQKIVNIIFHDNPDKIKMLPCNSNFMHIFCERGLTCRSEDIEGAHVIHGANTYVPKKTEGPFYQIFQSYLQFNMTGVTNNRIKEHLQLPLKIYYSLFNSTRTCSGTLKQVLFKDFDMSSVKLDSLF